jgi:uncharacterized protein YjbI with pentapeptide repeats
MGSAGRPSIRRLREALTAFADGQDRSLAAVEGLATLASAVEEMPWRDELLFVARKYEPSDEATGEEALAALAQLILDDWARKKPEPRWRLRVPPDAKGLEKRWIDPAGRDRATAVVLALRGHGDLAPLAFGTHDGRLDFRGFVDPGNDALRRDSASLDAVDFSGARIESLWFSRQSITRSRFDGATLGDFRIWSGTVEDTTFRGAKFSEFLLLDGVAGVRLLDRLRHQKRGAARSRYTRVDFSGSNLSGFTVANAVFENCDFGNARLNKAAFGCDLIRCRFAGHIDDVIFTGHPWEAVRRPRFEDVDLSEAELHFVSFRGVDLAGFRLPPDPGLRIVPNWPCVYRFLEIRLGSIPQTDVALAVKLAMALQEPKNAADDGRAVLELTTLEEEAGREGVTELVMLLDEAEHRCKSVP